MLFALYIGLMTKSISDVWKENRRKIDSGSKSFWKVWVDRWETKDGIS